MHCLSLVRRCCRPITQQLSLLTASSFLCVVLVLLLMMAAVRCVVSAETNVQGAQVH